MNSADHNPLQSANRNVTLRLLAAVAIASLTSLALLAFIATPQALLLGSVVLLVVLWTNEGLPLGVVSLLPLILFPLAGIADMPAVAANFANPIIFLFLGGFMLAIAVEKTGLHTQIAFRLLAVFPNTARGMVFALALVSGLLSSFLSNTTTALLLMPLALFLTDQPALRARFALAIAYGASIGGVVTPIGTPPNLIMLGFMQHNGMPEIGFVQWIGMLAPLAVAMFIAMGLLLSAGLGNTPLRQADRPQALDSAQRRLTWLLLALVILLLFNSPAPPYYAGLGLDEKAVLLAAGLSLFLPGIGILTWNDCRKIPYEIIFLFGAGFSIAHAFTATGLADLIGNALLGVTGIDLWLLILLVAALVTFTTEITSNTALISMMLPVVHSVSVAAGLDATLFMLVATICASYAFMLPIATPPNAIAVASGVVRPAAMMRFGVFLNLVGVALISAFALLFWQPLLG